MPHSFARYARFQLDGHPTFVALDSRGSAHVLFFGRCRTAARSTGATLAKRGVCHEGDTSAGSAWAKAAPAQRRAAAARARKVAGTSEEVGMGAGGSAARYANGI